MMRVGGKNYINVKTLLERKEDILFIDFVEQIIERKAKRYGENFKKNYKTLLFHLNNFCELTDSVLYTNSVNEEFLDDFIIYLESRNLKLSYIKQLV